MTCKYNYKSISLRTDTMDKIKKLSVSLVKDVKLSNAATVEKVIDHSIGSKDHNGEYYDKRYKA